MPITLVTGLPGHGKTLYTLARWKDEAKKAGRPVFHNGIKGLNIPGWQEWDVKEWQQLIAGSIMVIDEAQFAFPTRGRGEPPDFIAKLATHRHLGIDIVVITQDPMLLDNFVRRLVDRHFHVVRMFGTQRATIHEFPNGAREDVAKRREGSIRHEWKYPKEVFDLYTSAELHTVKRRIPMRVWILLAVPIVFAVVAYAAYVRLSPESQVERMNKAAGITPEQARPGHTGGTSRNATTKNEPLTPLEYAQAYTPRVEGLPHTAPVYDEVTRPSQAPYPAACVSNKQKCLCYSQQGTRMETPEDLCRRIADGGFFVQWAQQTAQAYQLSPTDRERPAVPVQSEPRVNAIYGARPAPTSIPANPPEEMGTGQTPRPHVRR